MTTAITAPENSHNIGLGRVRVHMLQISQSSCYRVRKFTVFVIVGLQPFVSVGALFEILHFVECGTCPVLMHLMHLTLQELPLTELCTSIFIKSHVINFMQRCALQALSAA